MKLNTLQFKLSVLFIILLLTVSAVNLYLATNSTSKYLAEVTQKRNVDLAATIAHELQIDSATNQIASQEIENLFAAAMIINPNIKLYLIDEAGKVLTASAKPEELKLSEIDIKQVKAYLNHEKPLPVFGDDPRDPNHPKVFSVHPLNSSDGSFHCYLYIILNNDNAAEEAASVKQSFILKALFRTFFICIAATLIVGLFVIFLLTRNLKKMSEAVHKMEEGDYSARINIKSSDELSELAGAFNTMAGKIELAMSKLKQNDELRRELIANISHDLRTPLASVEGYIETILMKEHLLTETEKKSYLETILKNTKSLTRLVSELFQLSKLEAQQTKPEMETFSITELVQDILLKFLPNSQNAQIELWCKPPQNIPLVYADISLIERVLQNLIENAIRFTPVSGRVSVSINKVGSSRVRIAVADTGKGISEEDQQHIFDRFYRSDRIRQKSGQGLGLGLAIAKKIVELHGSVLNVNSKVNQGTTFSFELSISEEINMNEATINTLKTQKN